MTSQRTVRIEQPFHVRGLRCVIVQARFTLLRLQVLLELCSISILDGL